MDKQNEFGILKVGEIYRYTNQVATYNITFHLEPAILSKCGILCIKSKLEEEVIKTINEWTQPEEMDILDLKVNVFDAVEFGSTIYFMSSYTVTVDLIELNKT